MWFEPKWKVFGSRRRRAASALLALIFSSPAAIAAEEIDDNDRVLVFAAASMAGAMEDITRLVEAESGLHVLVSLGSSAVLARQIELGAPADLFITAHTEWVSYLDKRLQLDEDGIRIIAWNGLVMVAGTDAPDIGQPLDPAQFLANGWRIATGDPTSVPLGRYAVDALEQSGWQDLTSLLVPAGDARAALMFVTTGATPFGILYGSDAFANPHLKVLQNLDSGKTGTPSYQLVRLNKRASTGIAWDLFSGEEVSRLLKRQGFLTSDPSLRIR